MKKDLSIQTKYYEWQWNTNDKPKEIILDKENWYLVQIDASIRYIFHKYNLTIPKYALVKTINDKHIIEIARPNIFNIKDFITFENALIDVNNELKQALIVNEVEDKLQFNVI